MNSNPYKAPSADLTTPEQRPGAAPALWNPNAIANWSVIFTPLFGAILVSKNWRALGEPKRASRAKIWAYATPPVLLTRAALPLLVAWYFASSRPQARYIKERWGDAYSRRSWGRPLAWGLACYVGLIAAFVGVYFAVADTPGATAGSGTEPLDLTAE